MDSRSIESDQNLSYLPVDPDFFEILDEITGFTGTVNYFSFSGDIQDVKGTFLNRYSDQNGEFILMDNDQSVRVDRIITIFGKPGPSFEKYNHFSDVCFSCHDEGQF